MDEKKTGSLIKEARINKNYTQSELGDLLGVTNKAVSRWENGDSFPDVGVLENLSAILDLRIQDIVTGETEKKDEAAVTEIVRLAKLQQREKNRKLMKLGFIFILYLVCVIAGYTGLGNTSVCFTDHSGRIYVIFLTMTLFFILCGSVEQPGGSTMTCHKTVKLLRILTVLSLVWCVVVTWMLILTTLSGSVPFGMKLSSVGPLLNLQLVVVFIINITVLGVQLYRYEKKDAGIDRGCMVSAAAVYLTALYGDMLHRLDTVDAVIRILMSRTLIVFVELGLAVVVARLLERTKGCQIRR